jgi:hypothetical protein
LTIEAIRQNVRAGRYQIKLHAVQHALKEGFGEQEIVDAILSGRIIEEYPERQRTLICGLLTIEQDTGIYMHVVCEQNYPDQVEIVTAYIPDAREWENPPFRRRRRRA